METSSRAALGRTVQDLRRGFAAPPPGSRVMVRWWWFGPFVEEEELARELGAMAAAGIGGVEVAFTSPVAPSSDPGAGFLTDGFLRCLRFAAGRAAALGLRFDVTLGSGWSFGGPHVDEDLAARCLRWDEREVPPGPARMPVPTGWPGDVLVAAYLAEGSVQEVVADYREVPVRDGTVELPEGTGPRRLLLAVSGLTGQNVKRAAVGAEGLVLDHCSRAATRAHLAAVGEPLLAAASADLVTAVFCDSLEVYGADWTPAMLEEFSARRGHDLRPLLWQLHTPGPASAQVRADVTRTLGELYEENFLAVVQRWATEHGVLFRVQSYGAPPATLSSYRLVDLPEGEGWGWRSVTQTKWATSAAHLYGRDVVSSETWTWVRSPSYAATPLDLKAEAHEHLLLGVNQLVGHGWPYSPAGAQEPGQVFYAAGALSDHNPWWPVVPELTGYLHRLCWLLQQGEPVVDVALYAPTTDATRRPPADGAQVHLDLWRSTREHVGEDLPAALREAGYDYDLVDDTALLEGDLGRYRVVVLPDVHHLPAASARRLDAFVADGGAVVAVAGGVDAPSWASVAGVPELPAALAQVVAPDVRLLPATPDVGVVHRRTPDADVHLVVNTGAQRRAVTVLPRSAGTTVERWDALTGGSQPCETVDGGVALDLHPYEAAVLVSTRSPGGREPLGPRPGAAPAAALELGGPWTVAYADAPDAASPVSLPHVWDDEPGRRDYSGAARYRTTVVLGPDRVQGRVVLDLGQGRPPARGTEGDPGIRGASYRVALSAPVGEVALVTVNGRSCGRAWAPPFVVDVTDAVEDGENTVEVSVLSTAVAALRDGTEREADLAAARASYGWRYTVQDLEVAQHPTASGLRSVPALRFSSP